QKRFHLVTSEIEYVCAPILMQSLAWIFMFIQRSAVKPGQGKCVPRKMRGYPVEDDADASAMTGIHKKLEIGRRAMAAGGGKITCCLVTPGFIKRVLRNREQFDMGVAHLSYIRNQMMGKFAVTIKSPVRVPFPRAR